MTTDRPSLTPRQREAYAFIISYLEQYARPPTLQEIGLELNVRSLNSVVKLTSILERKGYLVREPGRARGLRLTAASSGAPSESPPYRMLSVRDAHMNSFVRPLPGWTDSICVDQRFFRGVAQPATCFVARIADNGMIVDGIRRNDLIVVEPTDVTRVLQGDLVACVYDGDFLARRIVLSGSERLLMASDRTYAPFRDEDKNGDARIRGRILGVMRQV